jgi:hypothetical protein
MSLLLRTYGWEDEGGTRMGMEDAAKQRACMRELVRMAVVPKHHSRISDGCRFLRKGMGMSRRDGNLR